jgi:ribosomal protein L37AE/L43A
MLIIGVHKAFIHAGRWVRHRPSTKKRYKVFFLNDETGKFGSFYTDSVSAMAYKLQKCKRKTIPCLVCGSKNVIYYRNKRELMENPCSACGASLEDIANALEESS